MLEGEGEGADEGDQGRVEGSWWEGGGEVEEGEDDDVLGPCGIKEAVQVTKVLARKSERSETRRVQRLTSIKKLVDRDLDILSSELSSDPFRTSGQIISSAENDVKGGVNPVVDSRRVVKVDVDLLKDVRDFRKLKGRERTEGALLLFGGRSGEGPAEKKKRRSRDASSQREREEK